MGSVSEKVVLMICGDYMEDYEAIVPFTVLQAFGVTVRCVSPAKKSGDKCITAIHDYMGFELYTELQGHFFTLNLNFDEVNPESYDALIIPGGRFTEPLSCNDDVIAIVKRFEERGKPIATSCHSQILLVAAEILQGKKCTAFNSLKPIIELAGGIWWEQPGVKSALDLTACVRDKNIISSIGWPGHCEYLKVLIDSMGGNIGSSKRTSVLILCADYAEDYEINVPFRALGCLGSKVDVVCPSKKRGESCVTAIHDDEGGQVCSEKRGHNFTVTANWSEICVDDYDCLVIPGGRSPELLAIEDKVLHLVEEFAGQNKVIAAIGHGIWVLASANALKGKKCAANDGMKAIVRVAGGSVADQSEGTVIDGNLVTTAGWQTLPSFIAELSKVLGLSLAFS